MHLDRDPWAGGSLHPRRTPRMPTAGSDFLGWKELRHLPPGMRGLEIPSPGMPSWGSHLQFQKTLSTPSSLPISLLLPESEATPGCPPVKFLECNS